MAKGYWIACLDVADQAALDCYKSSEHENAKTARGDGAELDLVIIEGNDGPQP